MGWCKALAHRQNYYNGGLTGIVQLTLRVLFVYSAKRLEYRLPGSEGGKNGALTKGAVKLLVNSLWLWLDCLFKHQ